MIKEPPVPSRDLRIERLSAELVIVGGGLAGTCAAITAARAGMKVVLIQDRPVLGGNASSEVRLWVLGATSHMHTNNRWAREGGVVDELLVENLHRNPEGNALIFDTVLLEKVVAEPNITLLLNTAVLEVTKSDADTIRSVRGFCAQNSTMYEAIAPLFCDASGDGVVGFLAGAAFRMGAESREEFGEKFAPSQAYGELLGHSIYFYSKDTGRPVRFVPPSYALMDITKIPRYRQFNTRNYGCMLWWIEYGGRLDTVHETERIKWELWKVVYGVWNHIKNSGQFPEAENLTLEWVGQIPGKRESRRFEGPYMLRQQDLIEQRSHADAVAFGGWSIDLHPADGVYSPLPGCDQWHAKGTYSIPYRCLYSRNIRNLFMAGRVISASHVAFGSTRVMATCAHGAQAVALAASQRRAPAEVDVPRLQLDLLRSGQHIPGMRLEDPDDVARLAAITASSELRLAELAGDGPLLPLKDAWAMMLPVASGAMPAVTFTATVELDTTLEVELRTSSRPGNHTPDLTLAKRSIALARGTDQPVRVALDVAVQEPCYVFVCLMPNPLVQVRCSERRITGVLAVSRRRIQQPATDIGVDSFEFWTPLRRPGGQNLAMNIDPPLSVFNPRNVVNGVARPTTQPNAWVAQLADPAPSLTLRWDSPRALRRVVLGFDTDFDHPMETVLYGHPERASPFCVRHYRVRDGGGALLREVTDNHQTRNTLTFDPPIATDRLVVECLASHGAAPAAIFEVRCYE